jgi:hypothetical protein
MFIFQGFFDLKYIFGLSIFTNHQIIDHEKNIFLQKSSDVDNSFDHN